jgi:hypothetical protein
MRVFVRECCLKSVIRHCSSYSEFVVDLGGGGGGGAKVRLSHLEKEKQGCQRGKVGCLTDVLGEGDFSDGEGELFFFGNSSFLDGENCIFGSILICTDCYANS